MPINLRSLANAVRISVRFLQKFRSGPTGSAGPATPTPARHAPTSKPATPGAYPGDFNGTAAIRYAPQPDGSPDPGEIVWAWVPYEEDHGRGKDRPVLLVGKNGRYLLGVMLTSKDHDQAGNRTGEYVDIGTGSWDRQRRPSEANLGRILQVSPDAIRREGAVLDRKRFDLVAAGIRRRHGWK
ncbi:type II toxin-antitoxin system PemK/MazF family toxin [Pseudarthrobacter sp. HLT3-5]|uniref:type II toxin-antitoxin system PemK/MazF family toxin n=1 Tax=Pseudarthrobacter cellobiosi TaxID=2953654 RepID=UPI00208E5229|nr:type II toxin-antitoxin system PemK/MazF family toxin [Pseudarthrobacter sp. HLT3-5]MCO4274076.1 type II toxin-antitoxin system PemK/MazF family toxin [Pseudarthrobacter sp. HLT3-5]